jgi:uncharacterized delta-60 repeat protein
MELLQPILKSAMTLFYVAIQPDGKIVAGGRRQTDLGNTTSCAVARYNPDGTLDNTFADDGKMAIQFAPGNEEISSLLIQPDGKIVLTGIHYSFLGRPDFLVARLNANGVPDTTFGENGFILTDFHSDFDLAASVALQCDGKIIVVGDALKSGTAVMQDIAVCRYTTNGSPDSTFGSNGKVTVDIYGTEDASRSVAVFEEGKIVIAGWSMSPAGFYEFALIQLNTDGTLDNSFGGDGRVTTNFGPYHDNSTCLLIQNDKIIAGGATGITEPGSSRDDYDFALARYNRDGSLDVSFGTDGKTKSDFSRESGFASISQVSDISMHGNRLYAVGLTAYPQTIADSSLVYGTVAAYELEPVQCPPIQISDINATPKVLWPPNHKMVEVRLNYNVVTSCLSCNSCVLSINSNEGTIAGSDWQIVDNHTVKLKAARSHSGDGRTYTINVTCRDLSGQSASATTTVIVPRNMSFKSEIKQLRSIRRDGIFTVLSSPNPSRGHFNLQVQSESQLTYDVKITDVSGKVIEVRNHINPYTILTLGDSYRAGTYYALITQGGERRIIKLSKVY